MMTDLLVIAVLALILGGASVYIYRAKKKGRKCIGCPDAPICGKNCGSCSGCCCNKEQGTIKK